MLRRNFFAILLAPLVTRFCPKPEPLNLHFPFEFHIAPGTISAGVEAQRKLLLLQLAQHNYISYECAIGTGWMSDYYDNKVSAPLVVIPPIEKPWEVS